MATRIWVRSCIRPDANLTPQKSIERMGGNQGNLLYQFSVFRSLLADSAEVSTITYGQFDRGDAAARADRINNGADRLVLPLSSSFRLQMIRELNDWADVIERLRVPVTVVGVGAQLRLADVEAKTFLPSRVTGVIASKSQISDHEQAVRRFVNAVLERSNTIGVRGEVTKSYLEYLGVAGDRIDVIGCPSLFMWGPNFRLDEAPARLSNRAQLSLSFDHRIDSTADLLQRTVTSYPQSTVYVQEKLAAQMVIDGSETRSDWNGDGRFPVRTDHPLYRNHRLVYSPTAWSWIEHLRAKEFAFGPRLHGTVAAILSGTPAHLLIHDSRTFEVAQHHGVPYTLVRDLDDKTTARSLASASDPTAFNDLYDQRFAEYLAFLDHNELPNAYREPSQRLSSFDAAVDSPRRAKLVVSNPAPASRIQLVKKRLKSLAAKATGR